MAARDKSFRLQKAEALARQREQEVEKLKSRLEQALVALKRKDDKKGREASRLKDPVGASEQPQGVLGPQRCRSGSQFEEL